MNNCFASEIGGAGEFSPERVKFVGLRVAQRMGFRPDDQQEFVAWTLCRLLENDCAVFRQFGRRSSARTYLSAVLTNLARDYVVRERGKWRPSAEACRLGTLGEDLEALVHRDGLYVREAVQILRDRRGRARWGELERVVRLLPCRRAPKRLVVFEEDMIPVGRTATVLVESTHLRDIESRCVKVLREAIKSLPAPDRRLLQLRFVERLTVARIARRLGANQRQLYSQLAKALRRLRRRLEEAELSAEEVGGLVGWRDLRLSNESIGLAR